MTAALTIGELGRRTGTKVETVRYYEKIGLLALPKRTRGNYRAYGENDVARLSFIRRTRDLGFSIDQVRALLSLAGDESRDCATIDAIASTHLGEIDRKLADLAVLRREIAALVASCEGGTIGQCRILEALAPIAGRRPPDI
ncbi:MerR family transcriptional regulator [Sphingopyxis alaskensis]|uniref:Transcriptional regulator, MerR family n=1 Tax=Sphingopyxis alaskensis (strain DSM 13593 / LMG 18877 / RB2256) TaxID=317655 RepID=Q1GPZ4_SPHAL|nr:helix-turn-helix domain-containing protein [Sphingopyxis alaskensis]ABF54278.1 transcriptional regulator, MerR family [Sphingopyxis alaskensis RB2256]MCM3418011.1 helix-turn-helix domain-containing protein [Sphingopyxis alaskensis]